MWANAAYTELVDTCQHFYLFVDAVSCGPSSYLEPLWYENHSLMCGNIPGVYP